MKLYQPARFCQGKNFCQHKIPYFSVFLEGCFSNKVKYRTDSSIVISLKQKAYHHICASVDTQTLLVRRVKRLVTNPLIETNSMCHSLRTLLRIHEIFQQNLKVNKRNIIICHIHVQ